MKRITHEPAYVLHSYDWSESSLILEAFTRHHGRTALVAKGAKRPSSGFRPVLMPLQPLQIGYAGDAEIGTLKNAEWVGGHVMPTGDALLAGQYLNELLMRLMARDDPHPALFDAYAASKRDDRGYAKLSEVGQRAGNRSSFDTRSYGYARLIDMLEAIPNFSSERRDDGQVWVKRLR